MAVDAKDLNDTIERLNAMLAELAQAGYRVSGKIETAMTTGRPSLTLDISIDYHFERFPIIGARLSPDVWTP